MQGAGETKKKEQNRAMNTGSIKTGICDKYAMGRFHGHISRTEGCWII